MAGSLPFLRRPPGLVVVCIRFFSSLDTSCLFFPYRTHTYISRYRCSVRIHRSIKGEMVHRAAFGKLETGGTRLARCLRDLRGNFEAKEGALSSRIGGDCAVVVWWPRSERVDRARQRRIRWKSFFYFISCPCPAISANKKKHQVYPSPQAVS